MEIAFDEHIIICSICGRNLIVKDNVNNGIAFLSHLKIDHYIHYAMPQMVEEKLKKPQTRAAINQQILEDNKNKNL